MPPCRAAGSTRPAPSGTAQTADDLLAKIDEIAEIFWETKKA